jgi:uncharacterized protein with von Willebrand factor type A (vWA) domain
VINTFMLQGSGFYNNFITRIANLNKRRVFFTEADNLGQYIIVDYMTSKKKKIG